MISMLRALVLLLTVMTCYLLPSCSSSSQKEDLRSHLPSQGELNSMIPANMRSNNAQRAFEQENGSGTARILEPFSGAPSASPSPSGNAIPDDYSPLNEEDLVWTDPDNPDQNLGKVEEAFEKPLKDSWQLSYQSARRLAYAEGKPLMIWFTDSDRSPICKRLSKELFSTPEFEKWSDDHLVKLRVDLSPKEYEIQLRRRKIKYAQALKKKFKVRGQPTVLILNNEGQAFGRYTGYGHGDRDFYFGRLQNAANTVHEEYFDWFPIMKKKGYRMWEGKNGVKLFARLTDYEEGRLRVVEPHGRAAIIQEKNLSSKDQKWIAEQKAKRQ